ncbi:MAG: trypsin-like peptidase domain-containing protein [Lachnospiraceae bacterium]|nr:trypsin-like peptidase domain-containing protein [Lachnospiraceae bacterium]
MGAVRFAYVEEEAMRSIYLIMLCAVLFCGCGEVTDTQPVDVTWEQDKNVTTQEAAKEKIVLQESPLLVSERPEAENLAGMLQEQAAGMMVQIEAGGLLGSGVIYEADDEMLYIATAGHVLSQAKEQVLITFADGFLVESTEYEVMEREDLAFIAVSLEKLPETSLKQYHRVNVDKERFDNIRPGDGVIAMGSKSAVAGEAYEGELLNNWIYVEDFKQHMMLAKVELEQGMSGGGLFDAKGYFLGLLCGESADGEVAVLPWSVLHAAFDLFIDNS